MVCQDSQYQPRLTNCLYQIHRLHQSPMHHSGTEWITQGLIPESTKYWSVWIHCSLFPICYSAINHTQISLYISHTFPHISTSHLQSSSISVPHHIHFYALLNQLIYIHFKIHPICPILSVCLYYVNYFLNIKPSFDTWYNIQTVSHNALQVLVVTRLLLVRIRNNSFQSKVSCN